MSYLKNEQQRKIALTAICPVCLAEPAMPCTGDLPDDHKSPIEGHHSSRLAYARDPKRYAHLFERP